MALRDEIKQTKPFQSAEQEAFLSLQRTAEHLRRKTAEVLKPWDLSMTQYNVLRILRGAGKHGLPCSEISARMVTADSDITRLLDRLEKKGLIERARSAKDRRIVTSLATRKAISLLSKLDVPVRESAKQLMGSLSAQELEALNATLERLRASDAPA
jgi:DNA-binding MarR family transcriptional regulator